MSQESICANDLIDRRQLIQFAVFSYPAPHAGYATSLQETGYFPPKMEANYMKDYVCCDIRLDSIHELLQYYEEAYAVQPVQNTFRAPRGQQYPSSRAADT